ncbi:hypothetical protein [Parasphingorhabdus sp.]|uniref:hypothetical protein n=1 Tax=Parasphingorhabdus sp. TaxID=2709688 RepID=UPI003A91CC5A
MDDYTIARVVHVASVLLWIGGVAFVTMVAMPAIRRQSGVNRTAMTACIISTSWKTALPGKREYGFCLLAGAGFG